MNIIRYRWGQYNLDAPQLDPFPMDRDSSALSIFVGDTMAWEGDAAPELEAFARSCALQVAHLWDCPEAVRQFLEGDLSLKFVAGLSAWHATNMHRAIYLWNRDRDWMRKNLAMSAARIVTGDSTPRAMAVESYKASTYAANMSKEPHQSPRPATTLRDFLLMRALPERLWPLIQDESGVLGDALIELSSRARVAAPVLSAGVPAGSQG